MATLTLKEALDVKPGNSVVFDPDLTQPGIKDQVYGIRDLTEGMGLEPNKKYLVTEVDIQRGTVVTSYRYDGKGFKAQMSIIPSNELHNVIFRLNDKWFGYSWFSR